MGLWVEAGSGSRASPPYGSRGCGVWENGAKSGEGGVLGRIGLHSILVMLSLNL